MVNIYLISVMFALEEVIDSLGLALFHIQLYQVGLNERYHIFEWHSVAGLVLLYDRGKR
tara:strand:- start:673 stop:849 length:177 start_codon:yes stop_codon:yes gene_type:complete